MKKRVAKPGEYDSLISAVRDNLTPDLLKPDFQGAPFPMGHCYVASEALYHLAGGKASGLKPVRLRMPDGAVHWWLRDSQGNVIDPTHDQFSDPVPYELGKPGGFLTLQPSKRAQELMKRVKDSGKIASEDRMYEREEQAFKDTGEGHEQAIPYVYFNGQVYLDPPGGLHANIYRNLPVDVRNEMRKTWGSDWENIYYHRGDDVVYAGRVWSDGEVVDWHDYPVPYPVQQAILAQVKREYPDYVLLQPNYKGPSTPDGGTETMMGLGAAPKNLDPGDPEKVIETPWPEEEPTTIPEKWPEREPAREPSKEPAKVGQQCPMGLDPGEPEKIIETPWPEEEPLIVPEPVRQPERVPEKVGADEDVPYAYSQELYGWKILEVRADGTLWSPTYKVEWPIGKPLKAPEFNPSEEVRNLSGIHTTDQEHWHELYTYLNGPTFRVLVKCSLHGQTIKGTKGIYRSQGAMPVLVVGTNKDLLFKVAQKYAIDTELVERSEKEEYEVLYETYNGWRVIDSESSHPLDYKGFRFDYHFQESGSGEMLHLQDTNGVTQAVIEINTRNEEVNKIQNIRGSYDPQIIEEIQDFFRNGPYEEYSWSKDGQLNMGDLEYEYEIADWRDYESISDEQDLLNIMQHFPDYDNWSYEWDDSDVGWELSDPKDTDNYGLRYWTATVYEPLPPEVRFDEDDWNIIFTDIIEDLFKGYVEPTDATVAQALVYVPFMMLEDPYQKWPGGDPTQFIDNELNKVQQMLVQHPNDAVAEFLQEMENALQIKASRPGQGRLFNTPQAWEKDYGYPDYSKPEGEHIPGAFSKRIAAKRAETIAPPMPDLNYVLDYNPEDVSEEGWYGRIWSPKFVPDPSSTSKGIWSETFGSWEDCQKFILEHWKWQPLHEALKNAPPNEPFEWALDSPWDNFTESNLAWLRRSGILPLVASIDLVTHQSSTDPITDRMMEISDSLKSAPQQYGTEFKVPQSVIDNSVWRHRCPLCHSYLYDRGGVYTCQSCPFEYKVAALHGYEQQREEKPWKIGKIEHLPDNFSSHPYDANRTYIYTKPNDTLYLAPNSAYHQDIMQHLWATEPEMMNQVFPQEEQGTRLYQNRLALGFLERNYEDRALEAKEYFNEGEPLPDHILFELENEMGEPIRQVPHVYPLQYNDYDSYDPNWDEEHYRPTQQWPESADQDERIGGWVKEARTTMYHAAPTSARSKIESQGLLANSSYYSTGVPEETPTMQNVLFVMDTPQQAEAYYREYKGYMGQISFDIWAVDVTGLPLYPDYLNYIHIARPFIIPTDVPPDRISLVYAGMSGEYDPPGRAFNRWLNERNDVPGRELENPDITRGTYKPYKSMNPYAITSGTQPIEIMTEDFYELQRRAARGVVAFVYQDGTFYIGNSHGDIVRQMKFEGFNPLQDSAFGWVDSRQKFNPQYKDKDYEIFSDFYDQDPEVEEMANQHLEQLGGGQALLRYVLTGRTAAGLEPNYETTKVLRPFVWTPHNNELIFGKPWQLHEKMIRQLSDPSDIRAGFYNTATGEVTNHDYIGEGPLTKEQEQYLREQYAKNPIESSIHTSDYNGWTNWETWNTKLMIDNERETYEQSHYLIEAGMERGLSDQELAAKLQAWATEAILLPMNAQAIEDAQEWNDIPEDERIDYGYEDFKEKHPDHMDLYHGLVGGPDIGDYTPKLVDPELVNWYEIVQDIKNELEENRRYEQGLPPTWQEPKSDQDKPSDMTIPKEWMSKHIAMAERSEDPNVMYHGAPRTVREQILREGLIPSKRDPSYPTGVFLATDPHEAADWGYWKQEKDGDVWAVDVRGLPIESDPNSYNQNGEDDNFFCPVPILPERLRLLTERMSNKESAFSDISPLLNQWWWKKDKDEAAYMVAKPYMQAADKYLAQNWQNMTGQQFKEFSRDNVFTPILNAWKKLPEDMEYPKFPPYEELRPDQKHFRTKEDYEAFYESHIRDRNEFYRDMYDTGEMQDRTDMFWEWTGYWRDKILEHGALNASVDHEMLLSLINEIRTDMENNNWIAAQRTVNGISTYIAHELQDSESYAFYHGPGASKNNRAEIARGLINNVNGLRSVMSDAPFISAMRTKTKEEFQEQLEQDLVLEKITQEEYDTLMRTWDYVAEQEQRAWEYLALTEKKLLEFQDLESADTDPDAPGDTTFPSEWTSKWMMTDE
jgi:hypothetical protein